MDDILAAYTVADAGAFQASTKARCILAEAGFSVGRSQHGAPCGLLFGNYDIRKWRNLRREDREALHGVLRGNMRTGPVEIVLFVGCPSLGSRRLTESFASGQVA